MNNQPGPVKAYENLPFLHSPDARMIRILSEYLEPQQRLRRNRVNGTIVFFGSARAVPMEEAQRRAASGVAGAVRLARYYEDARQLAGRLATWSLQQPPKRKLAVCTGGGPGIMEAANRGAYEAGGQSMGLSISLPMEQGSNEHITDGLGFNFHYFFIRKWWFLALAKAVVVFPGGFGTLDELFELLTLVQTKKVTKRMGIVLYGSEFWKSLVNWEHLADWGVISRSDLELITFCDDVDSAFETLEKMLT